MSLKERVYSVLVVSASEKLNIGLAELFPHSKFEPVRTVGSAAAAKRLLAERDFDFVIVNSPLPDEDGTRFAIDAVDRKNTMALMLVRAEQYPEYFERAASFGVFLLSKPVSRAAITLALDWLLSARERLRRTEKKLLSVEEKMDEIRLVNRAKWLLITELKMTEPDAHRYIEKQAMDLCVPKRRIAEIIIKTYS